jgi:uncharacterized membrane protein YdbT with pleckstrin-like domain
VVVILRKHWAGFIGTFFIIFAMLLFPLVFLLILHHPLSSFFNHFHSGITAALTGYYLLVLTILFGLWVNYYFDIFLITERRIINISQKGLLARETSELMLSEVEDVTAEINGFVHSIFNYGLLVIETAGAGTAGDKPRPGYFTVIDIPDPNRISRTILELRRSEGLTGDDGV